MNVLEWMDFDIFYSLIDRHNLKFTHRNTFINTLTSTTRCQPQEKQHD